MSITFKTHRGDVVDFDGLPESSRQAMVNRAISHIFGNEVSSMVVGKIRGHLANGGKASDVGTALVQAFRANDANEAMLEAWESDAKDTKLKQLLEGTLGVRVAGASIDPLERMIEKVAIERAKEMLGKHAPKGKGENATIFVYGDTGQEFVGSEGLAEFAQFIMDKPDNRGRWTRTKGEAFGVAITREAKARLAAKATAPVVTSNKASSEALFG